MSLKWMGFVRTYECDESCFTSLRGERLPVWLRQWIDSRYVTRYGEPAAADERHVLSYIALTEKTVVLTGESHAKLCFQRFVLLTPRARLADVVLWVQSAGSDLPEVLHRDTWEFLAGQRPLRRDGEENQDVFLSELWDECIVESLRIDPKNWRKTAFGGVGFFVEQNEKDAIDKFVGDGSPKVMTGIRRNHQVLLERNRCTVVLDSERDLNQVVGGYLLLAALCGRGRQAAWTLMSDIIALAERCEVRGGDNQASDLLEEAAEIQRRGVLARRELRAGDYLGDPVLISLYNRAAPIASVAEYDRRGLDDALEGLDRLVNSVFAVAANRAQTRLNRVGFVLAVLSVLLGAAGLRDFFAASDRQQQWVYIAWASIACVLILVLVIVRYGRNIESRARLYRRPGRTRRAIEDPN